MEGIIKDSIEYAGIIGDLSYLKGQICFKDVVFEEVCPLQDGKPRVGKIIRVMSVINILNTRIAGTNSFVSQEGQISAGKRLIVNGEINQRMEYTSNNLNQELHMDYSSTPFAVSIMLPDEFKAGGRVKASGYINDISVRIMDNGALYKSFNLLIGFES